MDKLREKIAAVGLVPFAQSIGVRYQSVQGWLKAGRFPPKRAVLIERKYGISRADLCPDVFGPAPEQQAAP